MSFLGAKYDWMMSYHHVATSPLRLIEDGWGAVERNQDARYFRFRVATLQTSIVVRFLVGEGRCHFEGAG